MQVVGYEWRVLRVGSVTCGKPTPLFTGQDLLTDYFKIPDRDELHAIRQKVTGMLTLDESMKPVPSPLLALIDLHTTPPGRALDPGAAPPSHA